MRKKKTCTEAIAKTGIKSVILGYQSILDTISEKISDKNGDLRKSITNEFPNVMKPLLKKKYFGLYEDESLREIVIFKDKAVRDSWLEATVGENGEPKDPTTYNMSAITLDDVFELGEKSWRDPNNYTVYNHGGDITLSLYDDDRKVIKEI